LVDPGSDYSGYKPLWLAGAPLTKANPYLSKFLKIKIRWDSQDSGLINLSKFACSISGNVEAV